MSLWKTCFMRGRRLPELAAGDFFQLLQSLFAMALGQLVAEIPRRMKESDKCKLLDGFERGRSHVIFFFVLKLSPLMDPPIFAVAHHKQDKARQALRQCLASDNSHPKIKALHVNPLNEEVQEFLSTEDEIDLQELPLLRQFQGSIRFGYSAERLIEGQHAHLKKALGSVSNHSVPYDSIQLRMQEIISL